MGKQKYLSCAKNSRMIAFKTGAARPISIPLSKEKVSPAYQPLSHLRECPTRQLALGHVHWIIIPKRFPFPCRDRDCSNDDLLASMHLRAKDPHRAASCGGNGPMPLRFDAASPHIAGDSSAPSCGRCASTRRAPRRCLGSTPTAAHGGHDRRSHRGRAGIAYRATSSFIAVCLCEARVDGGQGPCLIARR